MKITDRWIKKQKQLEKFIVEMEKDYSLATLNCMKKKQSAKDREDYMWSHGAYFAAMKICKIIGFKYPFHM